jgi:hypothetical protein
MTGTTQYNTDLATRQMQINEWGYHNKLETLFIFQIVFLTLTFYAVLMYLYKSGRINIYFMGFIMLIILFIIGILITNRVLYTANYRDKRFWNRRKYGYMDSLDPSKGSAEFLSTVTGLPPSSGCPSGCSQTS